jgi:pectin methylesterase-like acyl-CoA thioesterase
LTTGDRIAFENCRFLGNQDTLVFKRRSGFIRQNKTFQKLF